MIVADNGAILALIDKSDAHHKAMMALFDQDPDWVLPWAILAEVDYLVSSHVGSRAQEAWLEDVASGAFQIEWGLDGDLVRAREIMRRHRSLKMGLVDAVVMATAERLQAESIATFDLRHFGAVALRGAPRILPRDL